MIGLYAMALRTLTYNKALAMMSVVWKLYLLRLETFSRVRTSVTAQAARAGMHAPARDVLGSLGQACFGAKNTFHPLAWLHRW